MGQESPPEGVDLERLGADVLAVLANTIRLRHANPASQLDYTRGVHSPAMDLVHWASRRNGWEVARDRVLRFANDIDLSRLAATLIEATLEGPA